MDGVMAPRKDRRRDFRRKIRFPERRISGQGIVRNHVPKARVSERVVVHATFNYARVVRKAQVVLVQIGSQHHTAIATPRILPGKNSDRAWSGNTFRIGAGSSRDRSYSHWHLTPPAKLWRRRSKWGFCPPGP